MFGYTPCPCFRKLLKTHLSVRHARCWTTPRSVGVLPQIILFISSLAFRALSCIPCTPNTQLKLMEIQKAGLYLVLGSTELSPNSASWYGLCCPKCWGLGILCDLFWARCHLSSWVQHLLCPPLGGICESTVLYVPFSWASLFSEFCRHQCFVSQTTYPLPSEALKNPHSFHLPPSEKITASMFVVCLLYYSLSDSFISILIKNRLSKVN